MPSIAEIAVGIIAEQTETDHSFFARRNCDFCYAISVQSSYFRGFLDATQNFYWFQTTSTSSASISPYHRGFANKHGWIPFWAFDLELGRYWLGIRRYPCQEHTWRP